MKNKNLYYAWAENEQGASTSVNDGNRETSMRAIGNVARREFGSGWKIHVMRIDVDGDGYSYMGETEVKTFVIRKRAK